MATYAIGDIQGCYTELMQLLARIEFNPERDRLWLVGDLVNRGHGSLEVLRFLKSLGERAICVLGNHDLHLIAVHADIAKLHRSDTLDEILAAPDREELITWLRQQRLLYCENNHVLVHAGLLPQWNIQQAAQLASEVESVLQGEGYAEFLSHMYGNTPNHWQDDLSGFERLRVITNAFTRMRVCTPQGEMEFRFKGEYKNIPSGYQAWFDLPQRQNSEQTIIFGHWSALGLVVQPNIIALDTGCLWGGTLCAIRLEDRAIFHVDCINPPATKEW